ncbi:MAG: TrmB family transcriptional regulator [archaeon]|nr:MAG: TrmB family transcriptional regulator [archaeon]
MEIVETLRKIGMTEYEARIYLVLVKHGSQSAKEIATKSGVPKNRIYESVERLQREGFIEEIPGTPKRYSAVNPEGPLGERLESLEDAKKNLEALYEKSKGKTESPVRISYGRKSAIGARFFDFNLVKMSMSTIVGLKHISTPRLGMIDREAKKAGERGVKIRVLLNMNYSENKEKANFLSKYGIKYKHFPAEDFVMAVLDEKIVRIEVPDPERERINIWIENEDLAKKMQAFFDREWNNR